MKVKHFTLTIALLACAVIGAWSQVQITGTVIDSVSRKAVSEAEVIIPKLKIEVKTDKDGRFAISGVKAGKYKLYVVSIEHMSYERDIVVGKKDINLLAEINEYGYDLDLVTVTTEKEDDFGSRRMRSVEGTSIYEGKKTEVVLLDMLTVNLAANNARQIYSQVAGLNIYENNDGGLQLNIGGRGLDPNRSANFNTRQNGYDISADVLGYPESYYTPPAEALSEIQVIRGAASLQYGTQFGGLVNFKFKQPNNKKKIELISRQAVGSNALFTSFNSISGKLNKFSYYTYFNYKRGDGFRPNSEFEAVNMYGDFRYEFNDNTKISAELTYLDYLAKQPGGLTDAQFYENILFSNRERNWFDVSWKLLNVKLEHKFSSKTNISMNFFGLDAHRKALGFRTNRVSQPDVLEEPRDLIIGQFRNWGNETRLVTRYYLGKVQDVFLIGGKYYQSRNRGDQGPGSTSLEPDFNFASEEFPYYHSQSNFTYPNLNLSLFGENIFNITDKLSITPGWRFEYIRTESEGTFQRIDFDLAENPLRDTTLTDNRVFERSFLLLGLGVSYKPSRELEFFSNFSQNYRSVTFSDIRVVNPSYQIDPNISDESGFTADFGARGRFGDILNYDFGVYGLLYADRLGEVLKAETQINGSGEIVETGRVVRFRGNLGDAFMYGFESLIDWNVRNTLMRPRQDLRLNTFVNIAFTESEYFKSIIPGVKGNDVEFIPRWNIKTGLRFGFKDFDGSVQLTYLSDQFTDASNAPQIKTDNQDGVQGAIPAYKIVDLSLSYKWKMLKLEAGSNNIFDEIYFTRRATGYPGPGIIPSATRTFYVALQLKL